MKVCYEVDAVTSCEALEFSEPARPASRLVFETTNCEIGFNLENPLAQEAQLNVVLMVAVVVIMLSFGLLLSNNVTVSKQKKQKRKGKKRGCVGGQG